MQQSFDDEQKPNILVVDDDRGAAELVEMMLEAHGYDVTVVYSGRQAIDLIDQVAHSASCWQRLAIDLILLDIMMPGVDGFKVCQRVKNDPLLKHIPVVMITALDTVSDKVAAVEFGADGYLTKPFLPEELNAMVRARLHVKQREEALLRRNCELIAINAVAEAAASSLDPQRVAEDSVKALLAATSFAAAAIYRYDQERGSLLRMSQQGIDRPDTLSADDPLVMQILCAERPLFRVGIEMELNLPADERQDSQLEALIGIPLRAGEQVVGLLELYHLQPYDLEGYDLGFCAEIGDRIGVALQNADIFYQAQTLLLKSSTLGSSSLLDCLTDRPVLKDRLA